MIRDDELDRRIRIEQRVRDKAIDGPGAGTWQLVAEVWAGVKDMLPSRGESLASGINLATRPARVRIRYRTGIDSSMRVLIGRTVIGDDGERAWQTDRTAQITTQPAEIGRREGLEFLIEDYSSAGEGA